MKYFVHPLVRLLGGWLVGLSQYQCMSAFFSAICGQIDLKFGRDLQVDLVFQFLFFFLGASKRLYNSLHWLVGPLVGRSPQ
jgi:hypothetical protein